MLMPYAQFIYLTRAWNMLSITPDIQYTPRIHNAQTTQHLPPNLEQTDTTLLISNGQLLVVRRDGHGRDAAERGVGGGPVAVDGAGGEVHCMI